MILVRTEFQCKFGRVQEAIDSFKAMATGMNTQNVIKRLRIMTDLSGSFDTVFLESEVESINAYFAMLHAAFADPDFHAGQTTPAENPFKSGQRNFYTIEATYEVEG